MNQNGVPSLGVIGGGIWARHHIQAVRQLEYAGRAQVKAVCARTEETVEKISREFGLEGTTSFEELVARDDIDAVSVVTPDHLHREMSIAAMEAGKHVIVEKPMDLSVEGCDEMIESARRNQVLLFVDFHKRYDPAQQKAQQLIQRGALGRIQYGYAYMEDSIVVPKDWIPGWARETTPFWFIGIHQVDMLRWTLSSEVTRVSARSFKGKLKREGIDTVDSVHTQLEFANGASICVDVSWILPENFEAVVNQGVRFVGEEGILELDTQDRGLRVCQREGGARTLNVNSHHVWRNSLGQDLYRGYFTEPIKEFMEIVRHLCSGGKLDDLVGEYPSGEDGREATRVAVAVEKSARQDGETILLRDERLEWNLTNRTETEEGAIE